MSPRVLLYCQHLLGIGHYVRAVRIADALARDGFAVTFVSGGPPVQNIRPASATFVQLPPIRADDETFAAYLDANDDPVGPRLRAERTDRLLACHASCEPDVLLVETYPFGRRFFRFELLPLLEAAKSHRNRIAASIRDILVARRPERERETIEMVHRYFDLVLVHGDETLVRLEDSFGPAAALREKIAYTGYVAPAVRPRAGLGKEILVSAGGGAVGRRLLALALAARPLTGLHDAPWRLIAGGNLPAADLAALHRRAPAGVIIDPSCPDLPALLSSCRLSVSQAGYNTVVEVLAAGAPAVLMPFVTGSETEQALRCRQLTRRGLATVVDPDGSPQELATGIDTAAAQPRPPRAPPLDFGGAAATARILRAALPG